LIVDGLQSRVGAERLSTLDHQLSTVDWFSGAYGGVDLW